MIVAVIGPSDYDKSVFLTMRKWEVFSKLVSREDANVFLFNREGQFDRDCWEIVSQLKMRNPEIERHYYHGVFESDDSYFSYIKNYYDKVFYPEKSHPRSAYLRDCQMIDECDVLVTYYYGLQLEDEPDNPVVMAVKYAQKKKKRIVNLYELLFQYIPF